MKSIFQKIFSGASAITLAVLAVFPVSALAADNRCDKFKGQFGSMISQVHVFCSGTEAALWVIKILLGFSGTVTIVFLIIGGYLYLTSGGNDEQAEKGKKVLVNAIIGLVVIIMSTAIVTVVSNTLTLK